MKNLWSFGDSFTYGVGWSDDYKKWKGYDPKPHTQIVTETLNLNSCNFAYPGYSNDMIFDIFCENIKNIKSDDIVEFGWAPTERFRLGSKDGKWFRVLPGFTKLDLRSDGDLGEITQNTMNEILVNRSNPIYKKELLNRINLINHILPNNKVIHWSWAYPNKQMEKYETVYDETNGLLNDLHWSERGQFEFSNWLIHKIHSPILHHNDLVQIL